MISLLSPVALTALVALALPIVVHLRRRAVHEVVDFAALRWLQARPLPHARWRWHERWLLLLRLVLIAAAVLLSARPVWRAAQVAGPPWVIVSPDVPLAAARAAVVAPGAPWRWLAPGWPAVAGAPPADRSATWSSLLRELDDTLPASTPITVVVPARLAVVDAVAWQSHRRVTWTPVQTAEAAPAPSAAPPLRVAFRATAARTDELAVARALAQAWHAAAPALGWDVPAANAQAPAGDPAEPIAADVAVAFWLGGTGGGAIDARGDAPIDAWVAAGGTAVVPGRACADGRPLQVDDTGAPGFVVQHQGRGWLICLATPLTLRATPLLADPAVPAALLAAIVSGRPRPGPMQADAALLAPRPASDPPTPAPGRPLDAPLGVVVAALFCAERWWATRLAGRPPRTAAG